jgi:hypothetical protein
MLHGTRSLDVYMYISRYVRCRVLSNEQVQASPKWEALPNHLQSHGWKFMISWHFLVRSKDAGRFYISSQMNVRHISWQTSKQP